jgi:hypothetical protein
MKSQTPNGQTPKKSQPSKFQRIDAMHFALDFEVSLDFGPLAFGVSPA